MRPQVQALPSERLPDVIDVMADAFAHYPLMHHIVGPDGDVPARVRDLVALFVTRRHRRGGPMYGVVDPASDQLAGAVILTLPKEPAASEAFVEWHAARWQFLGPEAQRRYDHYAALWPSLEATPHHHLNMIGIRPAYAGLGWARPLLEHVIALSDADPGSSGVTLTTEVPRNVALYRYFGFEVVGRQPVTAALETWGFFRAKR
jgi:ribosomal protein S18 acetylase RimI-like enzyme